MELCCELMDQGVALLENLWSYAVSKNCYRSSYNTMAFPRIFHNFFTLLKESQFNFSGVNVIFKRYVV